MKHCAGSWSPSVAEAFDDRAETLQEATVVRRECRSGPTRGRPRRRAAAGREDRTPRRRSTWPATPGVTSTDGNSRPGSPGRMNALPASSPKPAQCSSSRSAVRFAGGHRVDQDQFPAPMPVVGGALVDAAVGVVEAAGAVARQAIAADATVARAVEPAVARQPEDAGAHQPVVDAERRHQADESGQPDAAAMRGERVAPDGDDQRLRARRFGGERPLHPAGDRGIRRGARTAAVALSGDCRQPALSDTVRG